VLSDSDDFGANPPAAAIAAAVGLCGLVAVDLHQASVLDEVVQPAAVGLAIAYCSCHEGLLVLGCGCCTFMPQKSPLGAQRLGVRIVTFVSLLAFTSWWLSASKTKKPWP